MPAVFFVMSVAVRTCATLQGDVRAHVSHWKLFNRSARSAAPRVWTARGDLKTWVLIDFLPVHDTTNLSLVFV